MWPRQISCPPRSLLLPASRKGTQGGSTQSQVHGNLRLPERLPRSASLQEATASVGICRVVCYSPRHDQQLRRTPTLGGREGRREATGSWRMPTSAVSSVALSLGHGNRFPNRERSPTRRRVHPPEPRSRLRSLAHSSDGRRPRTCPPRTTRGERVRRRPTRGDHGPPVWPWLSRRRTTRWSWHCSLI